MALPNSRDYTATDAGALPFTTVNAIQDWIVNIYGGDVDLPWKLTQNDPDFQPPLFSVTDSQGRIRDYWDAQGLRASAGIYRMDLSGIDGTINVGASSSAMLLQGKLEAETGVKTLQSDSLISLKRSKTRRNSGSRFEPIYRRADFGCSSWPTVFLLNCGVSSSS